MASRRSALLIGENTADSEELSPNFFRYSSSQIVFRKSLSLLIRSISSKRNSGRLLITRDRHLFIAGTYSDFKRFSRFAISQS